MIRLEHEAQLRRHHPQAPLSLFTTVVKVGLVAAVIPFLFHFGNSSESTLNGEVVASSHRDFVGMAVGPVALVCGVLALIAANKRKDQKRARLGIAVAIAVAGLFHALRGFGVL